MFYRFLCTSSTRRIVWHSAIISAEFSLRRRTSQSAKHIRAKPSLKLRGVSRSVFNSSFHNAHRVLEVTKHIAQRCTKATQRKVTTSANTAVQTFQLRYNKALHPTAYSLRFGRSSRRSGFRRRVSLVVVPVRAAFQKLILLFGCDAMG